MSHQGHRGLSAAALLLSLPLGLAPFTVAAKGEPPGETRAINLVEGRVLLALPAALPTGMAIGVEATFTRSWTRWLAWGLRLSWASATEYATDNLFGWEVRHDDLRLRGIVLLQRVLGRATLALRLGAGATLVHQGLTRRLPASYGGKSPLLTTAANDSAAPEDEGWRALPAIELEPTIMLPLLGGWGVSLGGGPSLHLLEGKARWGWTSGMGVAWQH